MNRLELVLKITTISYCFFYRIASVLPFGKILCS